MNRFQVWRVALGSRVDLGQYPLRALPLTWQRLICATPGGPEWTIRHGAINAVQVVLPAMEYVIERLEAAPC
jgi:hypothetical protein